MGYAQTPVDSSPVRTRSSLEGQHLPMRSPEEFRRDVIAVARQGDHQSIAKVDKSTDISETCLARWLRIAERQEGRSEGSAEGDLEAENRERQRRAKRLQQENEMLPRPPAYVAHDTLPK
jgi:transposase